AVTVDVEGAAAVPMGCVTGVAVAVGGEAGWTWRSHAYVSVAARMIRTTTEAMAVRDRATSLWVAGLAPAKGLTGGGAIRVCGPSLSQTAGTGRFGLLRGWGGTGRSRRALRTPVSTTVPASDVGNAGPPAIVAGRLSKLVPASSEAVEISDLDSNRLGR